MSKGIVALGILVGLAACEPIPTAVHPDALDPVVESEVLALGSSGPSWCAFGSPSLIEPFTGYRGLVYREPDPNAELPEGRQRVDLMSESGEDLPDHIEWWCWGFPPSPLTLEIKEDPGYPGDTEGFGVEQGEFVLAPFLTFKTELIPETGPLAWWAKNFDLVLVAPGRVELARTDVTVRACHGPNHMTCPITF